ncbi:hypothetical protein X963_5668 [Burkholderia pseudomallei MSHR7498]|nr:hypothetical protein X963_5668 [Burkholderia pseudomallei MSHR7498]
MKLARLRVLRTGFFVVSGDVLPIRERTIDRRILGVEDSLRYRTIRD